MKHDGTLVKRALAAFGALASLALFAGSCSKGATPVREPDPCKLQVVNMSVIASPDLNRAENGEARPVQLRIYQLATDIRLENASFEDIWKKDADTLKDDLIKVEEMPVYPASRNEVSFQRDDKAQTVAAVALFREPRGRSWYTLYDLPPSPAAGQCGAECKGPDCDGGVPPNPHYYIWLEESHVDDGSDHADEYLDRSSTLQPTQPKLAPAGSGGPGIPEAPNVPQTPQAPKAPSAPKAPEAPKAPQAPKAPKL